MNASKYLILQVRDTKLFKPDKFKDSHRFLITGEKDSLKRSKTAGSWVECPIDTFLASTVSNVLHVLAGERPVPTIRRNTLPCAPQRVEYIDAIAKNALVEVISGIQRNKDGQTSLVYENLTTRKSSTSSTMPAQYPLSLETPCNKTLRMLSWDRFRAHLGHSLSGVLVQKFEDVLGTPIGDLSLISVLRNVWRGMTPELRRFISDTKIKEPWKSLLLNGYKNEASGLKLGYTEVSKMTFLMTVSRGVEKVSIRDAIIYVPVSDEDIEMFNKGSGYATILDGGLVTLGYRGADRHLDSLEDISPMLTNNAVPVHNPEGLSCI